MTVGDMLTVDVPKIGLVSVAVPDGYEPGSKFNFQVPRRRNDGRMHANDALGRTGFAERTWRRRRCVRSQVPATVQQAAQQAAAEQPSTPMERAAFSAQAGPPSPQQPTEVCECACLHSDGAHSSSLGPPVLLPHPVRVPLRVHVRPAGRTYGRTVGRTDGRTDSRTHKRIHVLRRPVRPCAYVPARRGAAIHSATWCACAHVDMPTGAALILGGEPAAAVCRHCLLEGTHVYTAAHAHVRTHVRAHGCCGLCALLSRRRTRISIQPAPTAHVASPMGTLSTLSMADCF